MTGPNPELPASAAEVEVGRDLAACLLLENRRQRQDLGLLLAQIEREGRTTLVLRQALGELLHIKQIICSAASADLDCLLVADVAAWAGVPPS